MIKNYIKIALRNFLRYKLYSIINLSGLAVGLACFILIMLYINYEFGYEAHHENLQEIYRVNVIQTHPGGEFKSSHSMAPLGPKFRETFSEVEDYVRIYNAREALIKYEDKRFYEKSVVFTDQGYLDIFTIPALYGDPSTALSDKNSVVITRSIAEKYFGDRDPVGEVLVMDNEDNLTVTAVVDDFPKNTSIKSDFLVSMETIKNYPGGDRFLDNWISTTLVTYLQIQEHTVIDDIEARINTLYEQQTTEEVEKRLELEPLETIHLYSEVSGAGDIQYVYIFLVIGLLILLIASTNFMNLSTARSAQRANEVGLRKVVGAARSSLVNQFLGESIIFSIVALILAILLVDLTLPIFKELTNQDLVLPGLSSFSFYGLLILLALVLGLISGSYPALFLSKFKPLSILRGKTGSNAKSEIFRKTLVVLQFSIAIGLIICTLTISSQIGYMQNKGLGFKKEQILVLPVRGDDLDEEIETFKQALSASPEISGVCGSLMLPTRIGYYNNVTWEGAAEGESIAIIQNKIGYDFLDTYEIDLIAGRNFSREFATDIANYESENSGALIINEEAAKRFGWEDPIGKKIIQVFGENRYYFDVIGVMEDFHFSSLRYKIKPLCLYLMPDNLGYISIKFQAGRTESVLAFVEEKWNLFNPAYPFDYFFLDQRYAEKYQSEERIGSLFRYFSFLAIFISCLGLLGLASYSAEQRTSEIGVRKVLGAKISDIVVLLSKQFMKWIILANVIAWPLAWLYLDTWLDDFAYRVDLNYTQFLLAGVMALVIGLGTVMYQSLKAAMANPVESLRDE
jgi:putative ABC transport system permease protein